MSDNLVRLVCPDCGATAAAQAGPTIAISAELDISVEHISCSRCGYEGPNGEVSDDE